MIVVSDTSPLNYLVLIGLVDILPDLFERVIIPGEVVRELRHPKAPLSVRQWIESPPSWGRIVDPSRPTLAAPGLDAGEAQAIGLAKELGVTDVLIDDYKGQIVALAQGLEVWPTLEILEHAAERHPIDLPTAVDALTRTTYRVQPALVEAALARDRERKRTPPPD